MIKLITLVMSFLRVLATKKKGNHSDWEVMSAFSVCVITLAAKGGRNFPLQNITDNVRKYSEVKVQCEVPQTYI